MEPDELLRCLICCSARVSNVRQHFYSYLVCQDCGHGSLRASEQSAWSLARKDALAVMRRNGELMQGTLTSAYYERIVPVNQCRYQAMLPYLKNRARLLDINARCGWLASKLSDDGYFTRGLSNDDVFLPYWGPTVRKGRLSEIETTDRYDAILMLDYLERSYCPASEMLDAFIRLNQGGVVIAFISTEQPHRYRGAAQEFTRTSAKKFATECDREATLVEMDDSVMIVAQA